MPQTEKYYYINNHTGRFRETIVKWDERYSIDVYENYEHTQSIEVYALKIKGKVDKPKSDKYQKVTPILKDLFEDYYYGNLKYIPTEILDWEFYIMHNDRSWIVINAYSKNESSIKGNIQLNLNTNISDFNLTVYSSDGLRGRPDARKNGIPITFERFKKFLNIALHYLSDHESILIYSEQFINNFKRLASGEHNDVILFDLSAEKSFKQIISQLNKRKKVIEKRLIENDNDSKEKRIQLRGELDGINYSLRTINIYK